MSLGEILKSARTKPCKVCKSSQGKSLRIVAADTGISNPYLSQLENGKIKNPNPKILEILADYYGISYKTLMQACGYKA